GRVRFEAAVLALLEAGWDVREGRPAVLDRPPLRFRGAFGRHPATGLGDHAGHRRGEPTRGGLNACRMRSACSPGETASSSLSREARTTPTARRREDAMVEEGMEAPDFTLATDSGELVTLSSFRGKPVVLYFYPRDHTSGCTTQACGIRDAW